MTSDTFAIIVTIVIAVAGVAGAVLGWRSRHSARPILRGLGVSFTVAGLWVTGVLELLLGGVRSIIDWIMLQHLNTQMWIGIAAVAAGVIAYLIGGQMALPPRRSRQRHVETDAPGARSTQVLPTADPLAGQPSDRPSSRPKSQDTAVLGSEEDDAEITQILRKHGIE
ncbi:hypothetical protein [Propionibacterium sp.]|uniref:hypothetical protein n=1 Tax=Propionibacterium sp. TaxID=1977903 RepID=UPI0039ED2EF0